MKPMERAERLDVPLTEPERRLLCEGLNQWGGPARCTDELAGAMGFVDREDLFERGARLQEAVANGAALSRLDWFRVLAATEICFSSNLFGAGRDWRIVSGLSDEESLPLLRSVQTKLTREVRGLIGTDIGTRPATRPIHSRSTYGSNPGRCRPTRWSSCSADPPPCGATPIRCPGRTRSPSG
jgi:hypothetical protein